MAGSRRERQTREQTTLTLAGILEHAVGILEHAEDAVLAKDLNGLIHFWNPAAERLYGWTAAEAIGRHVSIVVPPELHDELQAMMDRLREGQRICQYQTVWCRKDGTTVPVCLNICPICDTAGRLVGVSTFASDMTDRKRLDEQLRMSELRFRCLFRSEVVPMGYWNLDGRITDANDALLRLIGYTREDLEAGKVRWVDMTPPEYARLDARALDQLRATGTCVPFEKEYIRKDGSRVPILIAAAAFGDGVTDAGAFFAADLSEWRTVENASQQQTRILDSILSSIDVGVVVADTRGAFLLFNTAAEEIVGIGRSQVDPSEWSRQYGIYLPDQVTHYPAQDLPLARAMRGESVSTTELFVRNHKSPEGVWISASGRPLRNEAGELCGGITVFQDITERKLADETERNLTSNLGTLLRRLELQINRLPMAYILFDAQMRVVDWNPAAEKTFGFTKEEMLGHAPPFEKFVPGSFWQTGEEIRSRIRSGDMQAHSTNENLTRDGRTIVCEWLNTPLRDNDGNFTGMLSLAQDITERKSLEGQLREAQRMKAIGQLAAGIAHDFNNYLTAINNCTYLLIQSLGPEAPGQGLLKEVRTVAQRAASLTRQLQAFSSKQLLVPQVVSLNDVVRDVEPMLRRVIGDDVELVTTLDPQVDEVMADPEELERVLLNLALNARDAMPGGGKLAIGTSNTALDGPDCDGHADVLPGGYVRLAVTDSGVGMTPEVKQHIFEPFFSTKGTGAGSGLGLAVVYGVIKQSGGHISVDSEPGGGTCFKIYLPRVERPATERESSELATNEPGCDSRRRSPAPRTKSP